MTSPSNRDPVCGMTVPPDTAIHTDFQGTTYSFCARNCRDQFAANPSAFLRTAPRPTQAWPRALRRLVIEVGIAGAVAVAILLVAGIWRPVAKSAPAFAVPSSGTIQGTPAGTDQSVDSGPGGVIVSAEFNRADSTAEEQSFTVSLNTHTVDLTDFNPAQAIVLRTDAGQEQSVQTVSADGERSSHHQNYRVTFARTASSAVTLVVRDVAGVAERQLTFQP